MHENGHVAPAVGVKVPALEFMLRRAEADSFVNKVLAQPFIRLLEGVDDGH